MKVIILELLIVLRLVTNEGIFLENRRPIPKKQPPEVFQFVMRPARKGVKKFMQTDIDLLNNKVT